VVGTVPGMTGGRWGRRWRALAAVALLVALAACGGGQGGAQSLRFQLSFFPNAQHAGFLVADKLGYYKQAGLDIKVIPGGPATPKGVSVAEGSVDVALADFSEFAAAVTHGAPLAWVGQVYQRDPIFYVGLKKAGVATPADLKGKRFGMLAPDDKEDPELLGMLKTAGVSEDTITFVPVNFDISGIRGGKVDVQAARTYFHVAELKDAGLWPDGVDVLDPNRLGTAIAGQGVEVNGAYLSAHRPAVAAFLKASIRGWQYAIAHPEEAAKIVLGYTPKGSTNLKDQLADVQETDQLVRPSGSGAGVLQIDRSKLADTVRRLREFGAIEGPVDLNKVVDTSLVGAAR
jgi:NitT/TauT family transport system substrate-binding protein